MEFKIEHIGISGDTSAPVASSNVQPATVPEGVVLVPVELTDAMLDAARRNVDYGEGTSLDYINKVNRRRWKAMLAAAPKPDQQEVPELTRGELWSAIDTHVMRLQRHSYEYGLISEGAIEIGVQIGRAAIAADRAKRGVK